MVPLGCKLSLFCPGFVRKIVQGRKIQNLTTENEVIGPLQCIHWNILHPFYLRFNSFGTPFILIADAAVMVGKNIAAVGPYKPCQFSQCKLYPLIDFIQRKIDEPA